VGNVRRMLTAPLAAVLLFMTVAVAAPVGAVSQEPPAWAPGQLLVGLEEGADIEPVLALIDELGGGLVNTDSLRHFQRVCGQATGSGGIVAAQFSGDPAADAARDDLRAADGVAFVQRAHTVVTTGEAQTESVGEPAGDPTTDPDFAVQWPLRNTGQHLATQWSQTTAAEGWDIDADEAWADGVTGEGQVIAILDDGFSRNHPDLAPNVWVNQAEAEGEPDVDDDGNGWVDDVNGWNVGPENGNYWGGGHGTWVAGIAAARGGNGVGGSGVAPHATLMPVVFIQGTDVNTYSEVNALGAFAYAIGNGADVINNSWGFLAPVGIGSPVMSLAVQCASAHDIPIAWSAGNLGPYPHSFPAYYPADNVVLASVFDEKGCPGVMHPQHPAFADVMAPGSWVHTTSGATGYTYFGQSSAAAPHVAGVMALVRQAHPEYSAQEVVLAIRNGARAPFPEPYNKSLGFLNAAGALEAPVDGLHPHLAASPDPLESTAVRCGVEPAVGIAQAFVDAVTRLLP